MANKKRARHVAGPVNGLKGPVLPFYAQASQQPGVCEPHAQQPFCLMSS